MWDGTKDEDIQTSGERELCFWPWKWPLPILRYEETAEAASSLSGAKAAQAPPSQTYLAC